MGSHVFPRLGVRLFWIGNKTFYKIIITEREGEELSSIILSPAFVPLMGLMGLKMIIFCVIFIVTYFNSSQAFLPR